VQTTKHHSGYTLWPSAEAERTYGANYNPVKVGPKRDLVGDLAAAVREKNIRLGLYYSLYEWYHPLWKSDKARFVEEHLFGQFKDLVTRYRPDVVWADGDWDLPWEQWRSPELRPGSSIMRRTRRTWSSTTGGQRGPPQAGGFYTTEYGSGLDDDAHPWEENRGMGHSYGYNRAENAEDYRSARELILMLIDVVSRGGNLCLDIGPRADGTIPVIMQERLLQIGAWLATNGEAIYGTRMWKASCQWSEGSVPQVKRGEYMTQFNILEQTVVPPPGQARKEVLFTFKDANLYAIAPKWPGRELRLKDVQAASHTEVTFLATRAMLPWRTDGNNLIVTLPEFDPDELGNQHAYAFRVSDVTR
jgi:alpha-L-fucosidase